MSSVKDRLDLVSQIDSVLNLTTKELQGAFKHSIAEAASKMVNKTKSNFISDLPNADHQGDVYKDKLVDAVRASFDMKSDPIKAIVHVMGTRSKDSGTYRARFFEIGTKERVGDDGHRYGRIEPLFYFRDAVNETFDTVLNDMERILAERIAKIQSKK